MALSKKSIITIVASASAAVLAIGSVIGVNLFLDHQAQSAFDEASAQLHEAQTRHDAASASLTAATDEALKTHTLGAALFEASNEQMLSDASAKSSLGAALSKLKTTANLDLEATEAVDAAETAEPDEAAETTESAEPEGTAEHAESEPEEAATIREPAATTASAPETRAELRSAAARLTAELVPLRAQAVLLEQEAQRTERATGAVVTKSTQLLQSAHAKGVQTEIPALASQETVDAFTAAVAALEDPAADADLAALITSYQNSWNAVVESNAEAQRNADPASIEPTYIRGILIVNKTYALPSWFGDGLTGETLDAFNRMQAEAAGQGLNLYISSGFRSYWSQESIYNRYVAADGRAEADRYSARPGHSEHQSGLTFDLNTIDEAFAYTAEGQWVRDNAHRFGFVIRYPQGKEHITGYIWEPWHLRYLGVDVATELHSSGLTLEEYLGVTSQYAD